MTVESPEPIGAMYIDAMRRLAASVTLITAGTGSGWTGMTATAVVSVSAVPPTLLVVVNRSASIHPVIRREGRFRVNILTQAHRDLVGTFSGKAVGMDRFQSGGWECDSHGQPMLVDAAASIGCEVETALGHGTHTAFFGLVTDVRRNDGDEPLVWVNGGVAR